MRKIFKTFLLFAFVLFILLSIDNIAHSRDTKEMVVYVATFIPTLFAWVIWISYGEYYSKTKTIAGWGAVLGYGLTIIFACMSFSNDTYVTVYGDKTTLYTNIFHRPFADRTIISKKIAIYRNFSAFTKNDSELVMPAKIKITLSRNDAKFFQDLAKKFPNGDSEISTYVYSSLKTIFHDYVSSRYDHEISPPEILDKLNNFNISEKVVVEVSSNELTLKHSF